MQVSLYKINNSRNYSLSNKTSNQIIIMSVHTDNTKHSYLTIIIFKQFYMIPRLDPKQILPHRIRMDLGIMVIKRYYTHPWLLH